MTASGLTNDLIKTHPLSQANLSASFSITVPSIAEVGQSAKRERCQNYGPRRWSRYANRTKPRAASGNRLQQRTAWRTLRPSMRTFGAVMTHSDVMGQQAGDDRSIAGMLILSIVSIRNVHCSTLGRFNGDCDPTASAYTGRDAWLRPSRDWSCKPEVAYHATVAGCRTVRISPSAIGWGSVEKIAV